MAGAGAGRAPLALPCLGRREKTRPVGAPTVLTADCQNVLSAADAPQGSQLLTLSIILLPEPVNLSARVHLGQVHPSTFRSPSSTRDPQANDPAAGHPGGVDQQRRWPVFTRNGSGIVSGRPHTDLQADPTPSPPPSAWSHASGSVPPWPPGPRHSGPRWPRSGRSGPSSPRH